MKNEIGTRTKLYDDLIGKHVGKSTGQQFYTQQYKLSKDSSCLYTCPGLKYCV